MYQNYQQLKKLGKKSQQIKLVLLILLPLNIFSQNSTLVSKEPIVSIHLDSARLIVYDENTTALEVVTRNILGIVEEDPSYFLEHSEHIEFAAHTSEVDYNIAACKAPLDTNLNIDNFRIALLFMTEHKKFYSFSDSLAFNYRWIRAGQGREAIITVNNKKIYLLRKISGLWKIYVWTDIDIFDNEYRRIDDN